MPFRFLAMGLFLF